jgi:hypothetical protein
MGKRHLYLLAGILLAASVAAIVYKWQVLQFPLSPQTQASVWTLEAHLRYDARRGGNTVTLQLPRHTPGWSLLDERFIARGFARLEESNDDGREVQWATREARGRQDLYYRATVAPAGTRPLEVLRFDTGVDAPEPLGEAEAVAATALLDQVQEASADNLTLARELIDRLNHPRDSEEVRLLVEQFGADEDTRSAFIVRLLALRSIPARLVYGVRLQAAAAGPMPLQPWILVHDEAQWQLVDPRTAADGFPADFFLWSTTGQRLWQVEGGQEAELQFSAQRNLADAVAVAERRLEVEDENLVRWSLLSLPLDAQQTYRVLLMVPVGAFVMLLLRNLVGVKTFGTFMPVLVALAFRETALVAGVLLFVLVVGAGLLVRFYLERLRLLLVPRLTAILILVVGLMALVSILSHRLGLEVGLSVALFPMVIMAMTIERMSVAWDERGGSYAIREGVGTLMVAALAYVVMSWPWLEHFVFVFPEFLLVLFALSLLIGRYSGYRLSELYRFRALAEAPADAPPVAPAPGGTEPR